MTTATRQHQAFFVFCPTHVDLAANSQQGIHHLVCGAFDGMEKAH
jgi:hypothetical protein